MNPYETLGVTPDATEDQIRKAYRSQAQILHPDKNGGQENERFQRIKSAYELLKDPERRKRYDETGQTDKPADFDVVAADELRKLFMQMLERHGFENLDYIAKIKSHIQNLINQTTGSKGKNATTKAKIERLIKSTSGDMPLGIMQHKLQQIESEAVGFENGLRVLNRMLELLDGLKCGDLQIDNQFRITEPMPGNFSQAYSRTGSFNSFW